jgi:hypothetical protein
MFISSRWYIGNHTRVRILLRPFGFLAVKIFQVIWLSKLLALNLLMKIIRETRRGHTIKHLLYNNKRDFNVS